MKNLIPVIALCLVALACGRFQNTANTPNSANANSESKAIIRKVADIPALYGKSKDEVIKMVTEGKKKNDFSDWVDFEFPQGTLQVNFTKDKADTFKFTLPLYQGDFLVDTQENLGILTGIPLASKTPDTSLDGFISFEKEKMGGSSVHIVLDKKPGSDKFYSLSVRKAN
ncbi:MAG TPA: hypothetical protein PLK77_10295 [Pyrinomonadaceae bacterium]|nr:hypothetical protein [Pyrinomonadaceae bacterium]